jgi:hypothetical protein
MEKLARIGSVKAIDQLAHIASSCVHDAYTRSGIHGLARSLLRTSSSPVAALHVALLDGDTAPLRSIIKKHPRLRSKLEDLISSAVTEDDSGWALQVARSVLGYVPLDDRDVGIVLIDPGPNRTEVWKLLYKRLSIRLHEAKRLTEEVPAMISGGFSGDAATDIATQLENLGAEIDLDSPYGPSSRISVRTAIRTSLRPRSADRASENDFEMQRWIRTEIDNERRAMPTSPWKTRLRGARVEVPVEQPGNLWLVYDLGARGKVYYLPYTREYVLRVPQAEPDWFKDVQSLIEHLEGR